MTWTRKQPTKPGYYWFRYWLQPKPVVLLIEWMEEGGVLSNKLWVANNRIWIKLPHGQWAGPIKEPK